MWLTPAIPDPLWLTPAIPAFCSRRTVSSSAD